MNQLSFVSEWFTDPHSNLHKFFPPSQHSDSQTRLISINFFSLISSYFIIESTRFPFQRRNKDLKAERKHFDMLKGVENFDASQLKKTDTVEKLLLPNLEGPRCVVESFELTFCC